MAVSARDGGTAISAEVLGKEHGTATSRAASGNGHGIKTSQVFIRETTMTLLKEDKKVVFFLMFTLKLTILHVTCTFYMVYRGLW